MADEMAEPKPAWHDKHPCAYCPTGYIDCLQAINAVGMKCCSDCDHPGRWETDPPYTDEEIAEMSAEMRAKRDG